MKYIEFLTLSLLLALLSCNGDDNDNPAQPNSKNPIELVGTWQLYSGDPVAMFSNLEDSQILNQTLIFVVNGNMNESIVKRDHPSEKSSVNGNWFVENKQFKLTDWQGNEINKAFNYKIGADSSLTLTINGKSAVYYKQEEIKNKYPDLIVSRWNNLATFDAGKERMTFSSDGTGCFETYYKNGFYNGRGNFTWSYANNVITAVYKDVATSIATEEYTINYLNQISISWTFKDKTVYYVRE